MDKTKKLKVSTGVLTKMVKEPFDYTVKIGYLQYLGHHIMNENRFHLQQCEESNRKTRRLVDDVFDD